MCLTYERPPLRPDSVLLRPLPDCWPEGQYPLRKDWSPEQLGDLSFPMKGA